MADPPRMFTVAEARASDKGQLTDATKYPDQAIIAGHDRIAEAFAGICGVAFLPTDAVVTVNGDSARGLALPHLRVQSLTKVEVRTGATWEEIDLAGIVVDGPAGIVVREDGGRWPRGVANVRISYTHGWAAVPLPIKRAALRLLVYQMVPNNLPDRATSQFSELGNFALATAGTGAPFSAFRHFGIPEVDSVLADYKERAVIVV